MLRKRAHHIFAELAKDLARASTYSSDRTEFVDKILCPLCLNAFPKEAIDSDPPELTEEHIIPEAVGGKDITLSCRSCNGVHGSQLDSQLVQMLRTQDSLAGIGRGPLKGRIGVAEDQLPARFYVADRKFEVRGCHPEILAKIIRMMREGQVESLDLHFKLGYVPGRAYLALLRIAYLAMFKELGYCYILSPA